MSQFQAIEEMIETPYALVIHASKSTHFHSSRLINCEQIAINLECILLLNRTTRSSFPDDLLDQIAHWAVDIMTKGQAASLRVKWSEEEDRPCRHLHLELEHNNNDYLTDNYHCTACGELVAANTRDPFQVI